MSGPRDCSDVMLARKDSGGNALQWRRVSAKGLAATSSQTRGCSSRICGADERLEISIDCTIPNQEYQDGSVWINFVLTWVSGCKVHESVPTTILVQPMCRH